LESERQISGIEKHFRAKMPVPEKEKRGQAFGAVKIFKED